MSERGTVSSPLRKEIGMKEIFSEVKNVSCHPEVLRASAGDEENAPVVASPALSCTNLSGTCGSSFCSCLPARSISTSLPLIRSKDCVNVVRASFA